MKQRGRKSAAALTIAALNAPLQITERQRPPHQLTDEEVEIWASVVNAEAADWFTPSTVPLLAQYCRHVVNSHHVAALIERARSDPELSVQDLDRLLKMQKAESDCLCNLATKMRIAQQSTLNHRGNLKTTVATRKPWEG